MGFTDNSSPTSAALYRYPTYFPTKNEEARHAHVAHPLTHEEVAHLQPAIVGVGVGIGLAVAIVEVVSKLAMVRAFSPSFLWAQFLGLRPRLISSGPSALRTAFKSAC